MNEPGNATCNIVIYDDDTDRAIEWQKKLQLMSEADLSVRVPVHDDIYVELDQLYKRRDEADKSGTIEAVSCALDDADILIVDYDLRHLLDHRGFATGEEIAYSARLFSKVKVIVVVNHPEIGLNNFDLTLQRDRNLKADVYVGEHQIANPGLWKSNPGHDGFVPWVWPVLLEEVVHFDKCLEQVRNNLTAQLLPYFGLNKAETQPSPEMMGFLGVSGPDVTLTQIIEQGEPAPFVRLKDKEKLLQDKERLSRVLVAVLRKWIRRWVLPPQTILADAPHLAATLPWGLNVYQDAGQWSALTSKTVVSDAKMPTLFRPEVIQHRFQKVEWVGRPSFYVQSVRQALEADEEILKSFEFSKIPPLLFAEDLSRFIPVDEAVEYDLALDGQSQVRAVCKDDAVTLHSAEFDPKEVVYVPQSMLV